MATIPEGRVVEPRPRSQHTGRCSTIRTFTRRRGGRMRPAALEHIDELGTTCPEGRCEMYRVDLQSMPRPSAPSGDQPEAPPNLGRIHFQRLLTIRTPCPPRRRGRDPVLRRAPHPNLFMERHASKGQSSEDHLPPARSGHVVGSVVGRSRPSERGPLGREEKHIESLGEDSRSSRETDRAAR